MSDTVSSPTTDDPPSRVPEVGHANFARVAEAFDRLRVLPPQERAPELNRLADDDPTLAHEVAELLQNHDGNDALLDAPLIRPGVPARIGAYRLVRLLGEGGMGTVWLAEQEEPVRRQVALKLIKLGMDTRQVIRRFAAERQVLARMEHPGIARVIDAGVSDDGRPYFVMELVRGERITDYADRRRLTPAVRLRLFQQVCAAVQHAHGKGVIHRDLKPSNILVTEVDGAPVPKVIDFGVAKVLDEPRLDEPHGERTTWTGAGQAIGTPDYMSPEQAGVGGGCPHGADIDIRSDVWSLGVVLFELLTGTTPTKVRSRTGSGSGSASPRHLTGDDATPRPSAVVAPRRSATVSAQQRQRAQRRGFEPSTLRRLLRTELDWIVFRALQRDPARRYATVAALSEDVGRFLANRPIAARPSAALYEARKFARRHTVALAAAAFVMTSLLAGLATAIYGLDRAQEQRDAAIAAQEREAALADRLRDELETNRIERGRLAGYAGNIALASTLLWDAHLDRPGSVHARWALRELLMRHPLRMSATYAGDTPFEGAMLDDERHGGGLLVVGSDQPPLVIDPATGRVDRIFDGATGEMRSVDLSPDGTLAVTGERAGVVRLWSIADGRELPPLLTSLDGLVVARFLDGNHVVVGDALGGLHLIPLDDPHAAQTITVAADAIEHLDVHRSTGRIAAGCRDGAVILLDRFDGDRRQVGAHRGLVMTMRFSPDGTQLASGANDRVVQVWNVDDGTLAHAFDPRNGSIRDLRYVDDGRALLVLGWWRLDRYDTATFTAQEAIAEGGWRLVPHADPDRITIVGRNRVHIRVWQLGPQTLLDRRELASNWLTRIVHAPCGSATVGYDGTTAGGHDDSGAWRWLVDLETTAVVAVAVSPDGTRVAIGGADRIVRVLELAAPTDDGETPGFRAARPLREVDAYLPGPNRALAFVDRDTLVMPTGNYGLSKIDLRTGSRRMLVEATAPTGGADFRPTDQAAEVGTRPLIEVDQAREILMCLASTDGRRLAVSRRNGPLHLIDLATDSARTTQLEASNFAFGFTDDGRHLIAGGWTGIVSVFDLETMERRLSQEHSALVTSIAMHPTDPDLFATASSDGTVRLWSVAECRNLFWLAPIPNTPLHAVGFDATGSTITVTGQGGVVASWPLALADDFIAANREFERAARE